MFGMSSRVESRMDKVEKAAEEASYRNLRHAAFSISKRAKSFITKSKESSAPGSPPNTRGKGGKNLRGAIFTDSDNESAIIGPRWSVVGDVAEAHEFGKRRGKQKFPERRFMEPALTESIDRFAADWQGSIGE